MYVLTLPSSAVTVTIISLLPVDKFLSPIPDTDAVLSMTSAPMLTLSTLLSSGISLVDAIRIVAGVVNNKVAEEGLIKISEDVIKGEGLYGPIKANNLFPAMLSSMIKIGEESGALDDILDKAADFYDDELDMAISSGTAMLEPLIIIVMAVVVAFIVFAIMLPMFDMYQQI